MRFFQFSTHHNVEGQKEKHVFFDKICPAPYTYYNDLSVYSLVTPPLMFVFVCIVIYLFGFSLSEIVEC